MAEGYNLWNIRALLREGFTRDELCYFCQVVPDFRPLYDHLSAIEETELADLIVEQARTSSQVENLLDWARKHNPAAYVAHEPYLVGAIVPPSSRGSGEGGLTIGDVRGGIRGSTLAGRDVRRTRIGQVIVNAFRLSGGERLDQRNRQAMLRRVKSFWISGVLEKSLHGLALLDLGMVEQPAVVENPLNMVLATLEQAQQAVPPGTPILDLFDRTGRSLLILGEPGSGKTTLLLELARDTIARAERDPSQPIPVVFNLSSWATGQKPVADWLVEELKTKYQVPSRIGRGWVQERGLLLLLDGLDEVRLERREACLLALNRFSQEYGLANMVVCSRIADYEALSHRLRLHSAVLVQPLTAQQVDAYLRAAGEKLANVRTLLHEDKPLQELTKTPLMLSVLTMAYRGQSVEELESLPTVEARRGHMLDRYVERMFTRQVRTQWAPYSREQTIDWLTWLARRLLQQAQTLFLLEELQPVWLPARLPRRLYLAGSRILGSLIIAVAFMLVVAWQANLADLAQGWRDGVLTWALLIPGWLGAGGAVGLLQALRSAWLGTSPPANPPPRAGLWRSTSHMVTTGLAATVVFGLICGLLASLLFGLTPPSPDDPFAEVWAGTGGLVCGLFIGLILGFVFGLGLCGLPFGLLFGLRSRWQRASHDIQIADNLVWSWRRFLVPVLGIGLVLGGLTYDLTARAFGRDPGIKLWTADGDLSADLRGHIQQVTVASFNQEGTAVVTGYEDGTVRLWAADGQLVAQLPGHSDAIRSICFSPDDSRILTASVDGTARLWSARDGALVATLTGYEGWISSAVFRPDGAQILTEGCEDYGGACSAHTARLWDRDGHLVATLEDDTRWITWASFSPDGTYIVTGEKYGTAHLWNTEGEQLARLEGKGGDGPVNFASFSPDGTRIMTVSSEGTTRMWDAQGNPVAVLTQAWADSTPSDASPALGLHPARAIESYADGTTLLWDGNGNLLATLEGSARPSELRGFNLDRARILTAGEDGTVRLWDWDGHLTAVLRGHTSEVTAASFDRAERRLVTASQDAIRIWDADSGTLTATLTGHDQPIVAALMSPDGRQVLTHSSAKDNRPMAALWPLLGLILGLVSGLRSSVSERKTSPNRGLWLTARNAVVIGLLAGLILAFISSLILLLFGRSPFSNLPIVLGLFMFFGLLIALWYGGLDVLQHLILRLMLARRGDTPWRYARFLDYATERIFLYRVGGGYRFVHRLLMEHMASREPTGSQPDMNCRPVGPGE